MNGPTRMIPWKWVTQEYNAELEKFIRKDPTQYWWLHRRWKTRPKENRKKQAVVNQAAGSRKKRIFFVFGGLMRFLGGF